MGMGGIIAGDSCRLDSLFFGNGDLRNGRVMSIVKITELRDMSVDQLEATLKEAKEKLFHLRLQARMERLDSPSELKKNKRLIARILTLKSLRGLQKETLTK